jgi:hypothetical protein
MSEVTLSGIFPASWAPEWPATLTELIQATPEDLDPAAKALRALAINLVQVNERRPILTAQAAAKALEVHQISALKRKWTAFALTERRELYYIQAGVGKLRQLHVVDYFVPTHTMLYDEAPLPKNGAYLLVYGGGPDVLDDDKALNRFRAMKARFPVCDVMLWDRREGGSVAWSIGAGAGLRGSEVIEFPDQNRLNEWRTV